MDVEFISNLLRSLYHENDEKANTFFMQMIHSESDCPALLNILLEIIINDKEINLKRISVTLIREMDYDTILNSIFILNQKLDPEFYQLIEILTDHLAKQKKTELIPLFNEFISKNQDILDQKAIAQLLSSISYLIEIEEIKKDEYENVFPEYFKYFAQTINSILSNKEKLNLNDTIFLYYTMKSFAKTIVSFDLRDSLKEFFHEFACFCLNQKQQNKVFNSLINEILHIYGFFIQYYMKEMPVIQFLDYFVEYCQATGNIPEKSLYFWRFFFINISNLDPLPESLGDIIINFIFPFFKFQPNLIDENPEQFILEFSPDICEIPLYALFGGLQLADECQALSDFIFQFAESYFQENINQNALEVCRLLVFVSRFTFPTSEINKECICNFYVSKIFPMMKDIDLAKSTDVYLAISICEFIRNVNNRNDSPIFENFESLQILIEFLKSCVLCQFEENNSNKLLFYFAFNAISNRFKKNSLIDYISLFDFDEKNKYEILVKLYQLNAEMQTDQTSDLLIFAIDYMMPSEIDVQKISNTIWSLCQDVSPEMLKKYFGIIEILFRNCSDPDTKEKIFDDIFTLLSKEVEESNEQILDACFDQVISLLNTFTCDLLDSSQKIPFFMSTVGQFIQNILFCIDPKKVDPVLLNDSVCYYSIFVLKIVSKSDNPDMCLETVIKPFLIPIIQKLNELFTDDIFLFDSLISPLFKFKGNSKIFEFFLEFYPVLKEMECYDLNGKNDLLASLIISNPSFMLEAYDQDDFVNLFENDFVHNSTRPRLYLHFLAIKQVLAFLSNVHDDKHVIINALEKSYTQRFMDEADHLYYHEEEEEIFDYDASKDDENRFFFDYGLFTEDFLDIINKIQAMLSKYNE